MIAKPVFPAKLPTPSALRHALVAPALLIATAAALASCSILPAREPTKIYAPAQTAAARESASWPRAQWSLLVARPTASQLLDTDRIVVRPTAGEVTVYKGASWSDALPELVQTALLRRFEDSQKILSVSRPGGGVRGEFQLLTELREFESVYVQPGQPQVRIELYARLVHTSDGRVVAARNFRDAEAATAEAVPAVVDAFSRALDRVSDQIAGWTLRSGNERAGDEPAARKR